MLLRHRTSLLWATRVLVVVWPLVHLLITVTTPLTSWKLAGWGMYAEPHFSHRGIVVLELSGARLVDVAWWESEVAAPHGEAFQRFALLASPRAAARLVADLGEVHEPVLVLLALPHADPIARETWHEVVPFAVSGERVVQLRSWSTRGMDAATVGVRLASDSNEALHRLSSHPTKGHEA